MKVPISWLREFVDLPNDTAAIADRLAMLGFPVASIESRPIITGVVVGRIVELEKHPNADRLLVARVDVGAQQPLTIATAATNVAVDQTIAVATIGARLPALTIEPRKMRGIASEGMMISAEELALPAEWFEDGIMQLEATTQPGANVVELFGIADAVLDVEITSNRVDAMSMIGLARELAASYGVALRLPAFESPAGKNEPPGTQPRVSIESPDCVRFVAQRFDGIRVGVAPAWMRIRLALAGQRPINDIVDVSNYVMLETGQPLHFYDAERVAGAHFIVRDAHDGEQIITLDGVERTLSEQALVIADRERALGLAGLMGGLFSEVTPATTAMILEAANFNGTRVRRMSKELGLRSEASSRHEKTLAPALAEIGAARAAQLLVALGATASQARVFGAQGTPPVPITLPVGEVARLLGLEIPPARIIAHLEALGCSVLPEKAGRLLVTPPPWRRDLLIAADLVEEVARMEGYENIVPVVPSVAAHDISSAQYDRESRIARSLAALDYCEIVTHSLHGAPNRDEVEVLNPLSEEQRFLRDSLVPGLIEYMAPLNTPFRAFEIGHVFVQHDGHIEERPAVAFGFAAERIEEPAWRDSHFLELKNDCEAFVRDVTGLRGTVSAGTRAFFHPGKSALVSVDGREIGIAGRIDPRVERAYDAKRPLYVCSLALDALPAYRLPHYRPPSKFPSTYRDLALVVDLDVTAQRIESTIAGALGAICTAARVFDEYRGPQVGADRKSLAVRVTLQRTDNTITDEDADAAIARAIEVLRETLGAEVRA